jgi:methionine synthase / methylenetetrahydrofolate reductase(NADPH)
MGTRDIKKLIADGRIHVMDGAMGTMIYEKGIYINRNYDELNIKEPTLIQEIHREYIQAGAEIIETNSFGATRPRLRNFALEDKGFAIAKAAGQIAREVAQDNVIVAGALGPLGIRLEPYGPTSFEEAKGYFKEAVEGLLEGGVDCFLLETFSDLNEMKQGLHAIQECCALPIIAHATIQQDGKTSFGSDPINIARYLDKWGATVIGLNCSVGPAIILDAIEKMAKETSKPLSAKPNAGMPRQIDERKIYMANPTYMAKFTKRFIQVGVQFIGGCCGTTPEYIKAIKNVVRSLSPEVKTTPTHVHIPQDTPKIEPIPMESISQLGAKLEQGAFISCVEVVPPKGYRMDALLERIQKLHEAGIDSINVPDLSRNQNRIGAMAAALTIEREIGIETILHYTCRDRNLQSMQSDLLGAAALGLKNLLLLTGDPPRLSPHAQSTGVFDIDSIGLTNMVRGLNHGIDIGNNPIGDPTAFVIGVAANPVAYELEHEVKRFAFKVQAGAQFAITQPIFDVNQFMRFLEHIQNVRIPIVAGIWPLTSYKSAEFLHNEIPGIVIPQAILTRMQTAKTPDDARNEGLRIAHEILETIRPHIQGVQVSIPQGDVNRALQVMGLSH